MGEGIIKGQDIHISHSQLIHGGVVGGGGGVQMISSLVAVCVPPVPTPSPRVKPDK